MRRIEQYRYWKYGYWIAGIALGVFTDWKTNLIVHSTCIFLAQPFDVGQDRFEN